MMQKFCDAYTVILVRPQNALNVGGVARAMGNFGFSKLVLVAPEIEDLDRAEITACSSRNVLSSMKIVATLRESLTVQHRAVAFSGREGKHRPCSALLPAWAKGERCQSELPEFERPLTALVFGSESDGLFTEELLHCGEIVRIPSHPQNPSLNLAQAVLVVLYEIAHKNLSSDSREDGSPDPAQPQAEPRATWDAFDRVDILLDEIMSASGFRRQGTPPHVPDLLRQVFKRTQPNERELAILLGFLGRTATALRRHARGTV